MKETKGKKCSRNVETKGNALWQDHEQGAMGGSCRWTIEQGRRSRQATRIEREKIEFRASEHRHEL